MGDIINLRRARKARDRAAEREAATARAAVHGESHAARMARGAERALLTQRLDGHQRVRDDEAGGADA